LLVKAAKSTQFEISFRLHYVTRPAVQKRQTEVHFGQEEEELFPGINALVNLLITPPEILKGRVSIAERPWQLSMQQTGDPARHNLAWRVIQ
jgi:hypothetical protein